MNETPMDYVGVDNSFGASTNNPLSRGRVDVGGDRLPSVALLAAATCYERAHLTDPSLLDDPALVDRVVAATVPMLSSDDGNLQEMGARTLAALAGCLPDRDLVSGLLLHPTPGVRRVGARLANRSELLEVLAADPSPQVRAVVASRAVELSAATRAALAGDPHVGVRSTLAGALGEPVGDAGGPAR